MIAREEIGFPTVPPVEHGVALDELTPDIAAELVLRADPRGDRQQNTVFIVWRFAGYLATIGVAKPPPPTARDLARAALRRDDEDYLRRHRGLSERTIGHCWRFADRFLDFRFGEADVELGAITPGDILAFLQRLTTRKAPFRDKTCRPGRIGGALRTTACAPPTGSAGTQAGGFRSTSRRRTRRSRTP